METPSITTHWHTIETALQEIAPAIYSSLNTGATETEVARLEALIGARLPLAFVESCKVHDGQNADAGGLIETEELLSLERITAEWGIWKGLLEDGTFEEDGKPFASEPDAGVKADWWNALWIPITYDGSGNHYCLDLDPAPGGTTGQIIRMWHDDGERSLVAASFEEWMGDFAGKLVAGTMVYSEDYGGIMDKDEAKE